MNRFVIIFLILALSVLSGCVGIQKKTTRLDDLMRAAEETADSKVTELSEDTSPDSTDLGYTIDDPSGTPTSKKVTWGNIVTKAHGLGDGICEITSGVMGVVQLVQCDTSAPATCQVGTFFWDTDDNILYMCEPANTWVAAGTGSADLVSLSDCSGITSGLCLDSDDGKLYAWDGDSVELAATLQADEIAAAMTDAELSSIRDLTSAANKGIIFTGSGTANTFTLTDYALTVLDDTTSEAAWATLLNKRTAAPASPTAGQIYYADGDNWDPSGLGLSIAYYCIYDGSNYIALFDEDGDWYINKVQAKMNVVPDTSGGRSIAASEMNGVIYLTDDGPFDVDIPDGQCDSADDVGTWVTVMTDADDQASLTSNDASNHFINADLTDFGAGDELDIDGNMVTVLCIAAEYWKVTGYTGAAPTDGGAAD